MQILTFAGGLIAGLLSVSVDLGGVPSAQLRLDGAPVCQLSAAATSCRVDLGPGLAVHELTLVRLDERGEVVERVSRWLNRPGSSEAEVRVTMTCAKPSTTCSARFGWVHPDSASPSTWSVSLDGKPLAWTAGQPLTFTPPQDQRPHLLAVVAQFPDGRSATTTRILGGDQRDEGGDALQAVPIEVDGSKAPVDAAALAKRFGGLRVRTIEKGESELVFVIDPVGTARMGELRRSALVGSFPGISLTRLKSAMAHPGAVRMVHPETGGTRFATASPDAAGSSRTDALLGGDPSFLSGRLRLADAVAAASLLAGGGQRRRAVVLILGAARPDQSQFTPAQVRRFLSELLVPLHVIRLAPATEDGWGAGLPVGSEQELREALNRINESLERQRMAWLEGDVGPSLLNLEGDGLPRLAGRTSAATR
ncbi:MAG: hypothetical protein ABIT01_01810 [Thermoanaerobaculia bacterium]